MITKSKIKIIFFLFISLALSTQCMDEPSFWDEARFYSLIGRGACVGPNYNPDSNEFDDAALHVACQRGYEAIVQALLDAGARASMPGLSFCTPLYYAAANGHEGIVRLLLSKDVDVDGTGIENYSPLQAACNAGHEKVAQLLLEAGANVHATTPVDNWSSPKTSLELALKRRDKKTAPLLIAYGAQIPPSFMRDRDNKSTAPFKKAVRAKWVGRVLRGRERKNRYPKVNEPAKTNDGKEVKRLPHDVLGLIVDFEKLALQDTASTAGGASGIDYSTDEDGD